MPQIEDLTRQIADLLEEKNPEKMIIFLGNLLRILTNLGRDLQGLISRNDLLMEQYGEYLQPLLDDFD